MLNKNAKPERVQKIIANSGFCSRRKAEELIEAGKVTVNGVKVNLGEKAFPGAKILIGKKEIEQPKKVYIMMNKPRGMISTVTDLFNRKTVTELVDIPERIYPVGRLDRDVEGLLLLTNDGEFANKIMHPRYEIDKTYYVKLDRPIIKEAIAAIIKGVIIDKTLVKGKIMRVNKDTVKLTVHQGINKVVKRIFKLLGYHVDYMQRIEIGNLALTKLKVGKWRYLTEKEVDMLLKQLKPVKRDSVSRSRYKKEFSDFEREIYAPKLPKNAAKGKPRKTRKPRENNRKERSPARESSYSARERPYRSRDEEEYSPRSSRNMLTRKPREKSRRERSPARESSYSARERPYRSRDEKGYSPRNLKTTQTRKPRRSNDKRERKLERQKSRSPIKESKYSSKEKPKTRGKSESKPLAKKRGNNITKKTRQPKNKEMFATFEEYTKSDRFKAKEKAGKHLSRRKKAKMKK